jgi:hypothetical protein
MGILVSNSGTPVLGDRALNAFVEPSMKLRMAWNHRYVTAEQRTLWGSFGLPASSVQGLYREMALSHIPKIIA